MPLHSILETPEVRLALAHRDIPTVYRALRGVGISQRAIAQAVGQSQSEVSEILGNRLVMSATVLERIADGLDVPRGWLGLAYDERFIAHTKPTGEPGQGGEEEDEDMKRRNLLRIAGTVVFGVPVWGEPDPVTMKDVITAPPTYVGPHDVAQYVTTLSRLEFLDREYGGIPARDALVATAQAGEGLLTARGTDDVKENLRWAVSEAHRLAGWACGDAGLQDACRQHMHKAMDFAKGDDGRMIAVLASAAAMEKQFGDANGALKLLQLSQSAFTPTTDPKAQAVVAGLSAGAYLKIGQPDMAQREVDRSRRLFVEFSPGNSLPFFAFYGPGFGLLASTESKAGNYPSARADVMAALKARPSFDVRCNALDTTVLATVLVQEGEVGEGVQQARKALQLVQKVGSQRVRARLTPMIEALSARRDSTCRDLAQEATRLQVPTVL